LRGVGGGGGIIGKTAGARANLRLCVSLSLSLSDFLPFLFGYSVNAGWETTALDFL